MLNTEKRNPKTMHIDEMEIIDMVKILNEENMVAVEAVAKASDAIAAAATAAAEAIADGGRLFYIGCGTSGRLGVLDASEVRPTYGIPDGVVMGIIAGGDKCLRIASENAEDKGENGVADLKACNLTSKDVVAGISAAGGAQYVVQAIKYAKSIGCKTVGIVCNPDTELGAVADIEIVTDTGAEPITGSTRMKAGTAQKLVLNAISTCTFVKLGRVRSNLLLYMKPTNDKLVKRAVRVVSDMAGVDEKTAIAALDENGWDVKKSVKAIESK